MKFVVYGPQKRLGGILQDSSIVDLNNAYTEYLKSRGSIRPKELASKELPAKLKAFIEKGEDAITAAKKALEYAENHGRDLILKPEKVKIWAPLPSPENKIACAGVNFADHFAVAIAAQEGREVTQADIDQVKKEMAEGKHELLGFWKLPQCIIGPEEFMIYPSRTTHLDYECEIAAIIGKQGKNISSAREAMDYIWGYTGFNDWSIRDDPPSRGFLSWALMKDFDTSASLGPCVVTKDEITDPYNLKLELWVNGQIRQNGNTDLMLWRFPEIISHLSRNLTLNVGDIITSGTCGGTALDLSPKSKDGEIPTDLFVKVGDIVEFRVEHIGSMKNKVVEEK